MENVKYVTLGIITVILMTIGFYYGIDAEVARRDYVNNVEQCKPIDGCLFDHNCNKYNRMIWEACND